ncbi:MAG: hypothetical protein BWK80_58950 [Desulfobacteraceae bacterium IS3]|nr:MAG: hypothetical protein BWK80_58950 [Desulfobacteraceae bacterium IS3]
MSATTTLKAKAFKTGLTSSEVVTQIYTITPTAAKSLCCRTARLFSRKRNLYFESKYCYFMSDFGCSHPLYN